MGLLTVNNWTKGITDSYIDAPPGYSQKLHNLFINKNGKAYQRPALAPLNDYPQIPPGLQQIDSVHYYDGTIFVKSGKKLYFIDEDNGDVTWSTLAGPNTDAFKDSELGAKCSWSEARGHLFVTPAPSDNKKGGCRTVKIYRNASNVWTLVQAGLPRCVSDGMGIYSGPAYTVGGVNYAFIGWAVFYRTYVAKVNGVDTTFEDFGAPDISQDVGDKIDSGNNWSIGSFAYVNAASDNYDTSNMTVKFYRTKANGKDPFLSQSVAMGAQITDDTEDVDLGAAGYPGLAVGSNNDPPPLAYFHTFTGGVSWFLGVVDADSGQLYPNRVIQGKPLKLDGVPSGNLTDIEAGTSTAFGHAGIHPVAFFRGSHYRIEGQLDDNGNGVLRSVVVSRTEGAVSPDICQTEDGIYFMSSNGFCFTDGYTCVNLSLHLKTRFGQLEQRDYSSSTYDPFTKRVFFGVEDPNLSDANGSINTAWVMDENYAHMSVDQKVPEGTFTTMGADDDFRPTAMFYDKKNRRILFGDEQGFVFTFDDDAHNDYQVDGSTFTTVTEEKAIQYDYISAAWSFGDQVSDKWVTELFGNFKNLTGKLTLDMYSINDDKGVTHERAFGPVREHLVDSQAGLHKIDRLFPRGSLSCTYKQVRITKGLANVFRSDDEGVAHIEVAGFTGTITLGSDWPDGDDGTKLVGYFIYFENDDYVEGYRILTQVGHVITVDNDESMLVAAVDQKWVIKGIPKDEGFEVHSLAMTFEILDSGDTDVNMGTDTGSNA